MPSRVITIVFTDIKGFTERTASSGRDFALKLMARHDELLKPIIGRYQGILIKTIGDAYLLRFDSPTDAVLCSMMMQATLRDYNFTAPPEEKIEIRIAINTGMLGSRRKIATLFKELRHRGASENDLARIFTPIGLDIGALTPVEIALSIVAQMVQMHRQGRAARAANPLAHAASPTVPTAAHP